MPYQPDHRVVIDDRISDIHDRKGEVDSRAQDSEMGCSSLNDFEVMASSVMECETAVMFQKIRFQIGLAIGSASTVLPQHTVEDCVTIVRGFE